MYVCMYVCMYACKNLCIYAESLSIVVVYSQFLIVFWKWSHWPCVFTFVHRTQILLKNHKVYQENWLTFRKCCIVRGKNGPRCSKHGCWACMMTIWSISCIWWNGCTIAHCRLHHLLKCSAHRNQVRISSNIIMNSKVQLGKMIRLSVFCVWFITSACSFIPLFVTLWYNAIDLCMYWTNTLCWTWKLH
jgi:hypothetical protein